MIRRRRVRSALKWTGVACCGLLVAILAGSLDWSLTYLDVGGEEQFQVTVVNGAICVAKYNWETNAIGSGRTWTLSQDATSPIWWPKHWRDMMGEGLAIPIWIPLVCVAFPTVVLIVRGRRVSKGYCQACGYDLTGNESGTCPECGTAQ
jgi:hypothetical protein